MPKAKAKPEPQFEGIVTVAVLTGIPPGHSCPVCREYLKGTGLEWHINHYLSHGYKLLYVGVESEQEAEGICHHTVAIVGSTQLPPLDPPPLDPPPLSPFS